MDEATGKRIGWLVHGYAEAIRVREHMLCEQPDMVHTVEAAVMHYASQLKASGIILQWQES